MRTFDYQTVPRSLEATSVTNLLLAIREYRGKQELWSATKPNTLETLLENAKVQSTGASNRIEGIATTEQRLRGLVLHRVQPQNRAEEEIAGYRDVLSLIHEQHAFIPITPGVILQLHRDLMAHTSHSFGGMWKDADNEIVSRNADGTYSVRFRPMPALLTPEAISRLCEAYNVAYQGEVCDPALLACRFVFDFVSIHPFNDGNGRMSRLLTTLLLERSGYLVGRYVSIERLIEDSKDQYYEALAQSSTGWIEGTNDEAPFVRYLLGMILAAYRKLDNQVGHLETDRESSTNRIRSYFEQSVGKVTKSMLKEQFSDISEVTIKRALSTLTSEGVIEKVGSGKLTGYVKVR